MQSMGLWSAPFHNAARYSASPNRNTTSAVSRRRVQVEIGGEQITADPPDNRRQAPPTACASALFRQLRS
jgi:hypothetical protein